MGLLIVDLDVDGAAVEAVAGCRCERDRGADGEFTPFALLLVKVIDAGPMRVIDSVAPFAALMRLLAVLMIVAVWLLVPRTL